MAAARQAVEALIGRGTSAAPANLPPTGEDEPVRDGPGPDERPPDPGRPGEGQALRPVGRTCVDAHGSLSQGKTAATFGSWNDSGKPLKRQEARVMLETVLRMLHRMTFAVGLLLSWLAVSLSLTGCGGNDLILATTTSAQDSGLLDELIPAFEKQTGYNVKTIAVGSGAALKMAERGDVDVLLVHAPAAEEEFMVAGYGVDRRLVMYNDFLIVGPRGDPAGIKGMESAAQALHAVAAEARFVRQPRRRVGHLSTGEEAVAGAGLRPQRPVLVPGGGRWAGPDVDDSQR